VTASSAYRVLIKDKDQLSGFNGTIDTVTPVLENLPV